MDNRTTIRIQHHILIAIGSAALLAIFYAVVPGDDKKYLWSMATGYSGLILLGITLVLGPLNILKKRHNPISFDLRRDIGIWCALIAIAHVIIGIQVHMGNFLLYFFKAVHGDNAFVLRDDIFGIANYAGLLATMFLVLLLILSNDLSMKLLKPRKWKILQQSSYILFIFTLVHAILFQVIEKRMIAFVIILSLLLFFPIVIQILGITEFNRKQKR
jgi:sulfoxide reductase heme-binding subunit YedZ